MGQPEEDILLPGPAGHEVRVDPLEPPRRNRRHPLYRRASRAKLDAFVPHYQISILDPSTLNPYPSTLILDPETKPVRPTALRRNPRPPSLGPEPKFLTPNRSALSSKLQTPNLQP